MTPEFIRAAHELFQEELLAIMCEEYPRWDLKSTGYTHIPWAADSDRYIAGCDIVWAEKSPWLSYGRPAYRKTDQGSKYNLTNMAKIDLTCISNTGARCLHYNHRVYYLKDVQLIQVKCDALGMVMPDNLQYPPRNSVPKELDSLFVATVKVPVLIDDKMVFSYNGFIIPQYFASVVDPNCFRYLASGVMSVVGLVYLGKI